MIRKVVYFWPIFVVGLLLDQVTKYWVRANIHSPRDQVDLIPNFLSFIHAENPGAAGGILGNFEYRIPLFIGFTVIATVAIFDMWRKLPSSDRFMSFTLGLILSGAIGNVIDRIHKATVTDFIDVYAGFEPLKTFVRDNFNTVHYPTFNVADMSLVIGIGLFLIHYAFLEDKDSDDEEEPETLSEEPLEQRDISDDPTESV